MVPDIQDKLHTDSLSRQQTTHDAHKEKSELDSGITGLSQALPVCVWQLFLCGASQLIILRMIMDTQPWLALY